MWYFLLALAIAAGPILLGIRYARRLRLENAVGTEPAWSGDGTQPTVAEQLDDLDFFIPEGAIRVQDLAVGETVHCMTASCSRYSFTLIDPGDHLFSLTGERQSRRVIFVASVVVDSRHFVGSFVSECAMWYNDTEKPADKQAVRTSRIVRVLRTDSPEPPVTL